MTTFDPQLLASFLAVEQTGSFTRAAARLGIQQPTVSQHIRRLEQQTGRTLVLRDTHSVSLTADGEAMIGFARNIMTACEQAAAYFSGPRPRGRLRIGISDDLALTRLPQILRDCGRRSDDRTAQRPAVRALTSTALSSGSKSLTAFRAESLGS